MPHYMFAYHGGTVPETDIQRQQVLAEWDEWLDSLGIAVINGGNPLGHSSTLASNGKVINDGGANPLSGYSFIEANTLKQALEMGRSCPLLKVGGNIEVAAVIESH